ncbi:MAG: CotH kinase family protein, partial [Phycisphaerae bacterium]|nr:CotH kinase family protein [Phycisphaerae bacterium]
MAPKLHCICLCLAVFALAAPVHACFMVGDFTGDCRVDFQDLLVLADNWFSPAACTEQNLAARWKLDETIETTAADASGLNRHGDLVGQPSWNPFGGRIDGALHLDGVDDHVVITGWKGITGSNPRTCTAWIRTPEVNGEILSWGLDVTGGRWNVVVEPAGLLRVEVGGGFVIGSTFLADNQWHHVAVVSDGTTTDAIRLYVDGRRDTFTAFLSQSINTSAANDVQIGAFPGRVRYFGGNLDDIRIYDRELTDQEVWLLARTTATRYSCLDLDGDEEIGMSDFAALADYWNDQRPLVVINELLADNDKVLSTKVHGATEYPDWLELYNNSPHTVDLSGWCLTDKSDQLDQWRFPAGTTIQSGRYLVVFASGKTLADNLNNYPFVDDLGFLHTNFRLSDGGEYLALVGPDADTIVHAYADFELAPGDFGYPPQKADVSYGLEAGVHRYFAQPTPGGPNRNAFNGFVPQPQLSHRGGCYTGPIDVAITCPMQDTIIRYTTNGTAPTLSNGSTYQSPIRIQKFTNLMVACFRPGYSPSRTEIHPYIYTDAAVAAFTSNLPIFIVDTKGLYVYESAAQPAHAVVIDTAADGRAAVTGPVDFAGWGGIKLRGSSSLQFPKKQYAFETWDAVKEDANVSILSMPSESDWIIHAPYSDKSLMRNYLSYKWSNDMGRYAVRTRFVEVFLNTNGDKVTMTDYVGVYIFMEKIKRDGDRVNIASIQPSDNFEPEVSGGYIVKKDRLDPGDSGFLTSRGQRLAFVEPKEREITQPQRTWLTQYFNTFENTLYGANFKDPVNGYAEYIDVGSWIDVHIMVELTKNIDGYRLSNFMYKDRGGKLNMGPIWDYNLSLGNANYLEGWSPQGWYYPLIGSADYPWYPRLFEDSAFKLRYADRWYALRRNQFATDRLMHDVDAAARLLDEAQKRNFTRWPVLGVYVWPNWYIAPTWQAEIDWMKNWLTNRLTWMDAQIASQYAPAPPTFNRQGGQVANPFDLTITAPGRTIYYTLDGSDPSTSTGGVSSAAIRYTSPVRLTAGKRVIARSRSGGLWSALNEAVFSVGPVPQSLRITELMYHPWTDPNVLSPEPEFVELANIGAQAINLNLCR